jgi:DNA adenine methylase
MNFYSPLRYPGGKSKLSPLIKNIILKSGLKNITFIEPFAGGAGVALTLLLEGAVDKIVINDYDKAIYSIWRAIKTEPSNLIQLINMTPITIEEWYKQRTIYQKSQKYTLELAFATLFLNRANRSGIITGGPIGGLNQKGRFKLNARFNKNTLTERINVISHKSEDIIVYNQDVTRKINLSMINYVDNAFIYFDPPYYKQCQRLYKNSLTLNDHKRISDLLLNKIKRPWILTYDDVPEILELYKTKDIRRFNLTYSAANKGKATEIIVSSDSHLFPSNDEMNNWSVQIKKI